MLPIAYVVKKLSKKQNVQVCDATGDAIKT